MRIEKSPSAIDDGFVNQFAVDRNRTERAIDSGDHAGGPVHVGVGGQECRVDDPHLSWMDTELSAESEAPGMVGVAGQRRVVGEVGRDAVHRCGKACAARVKDDLGADMVDLRAIAVDPGVGLKIHRAER